MKVVLLQDVKLGKGDIIEVSEGYGRNFLFAPQTGGTGHIG